MPTPYSVAVIVGSLRKESFSLKIANALAKLAPDTLKLNVVTLHGISFFNQDLEAAPPADWVKFREMLQASDAVLFVTPEYNRSIPGVLKNALDHGSRPHGMNSWAGRPAGIIGASLGTIGTALAQQQLRTILAYLDVPVMGQPEAYLQIREDGFLDEAGAVANRNTRRFLQDWMDRYTAWVKLHAG